MVDAFVIGHICLDIIPSLTGVVRLEPGRLAEAGPATISTGGAVSNTGRALAKLGVDVRLMGKVSDDLFGRAILDILGPLSTGMLVAPGEPSSYTIVINLSGQDRTFLHAPGCNATFSSEDVPNEALAGAKLMHFGYPPLMERMFASDGEELVRLFRRVKEAGLTTSLDMSLPDSNGPAGRADWRLILSRVLPFCDFFLPSYEELSVLLDPLQVGSGRPCHVLAEETLDLGAKVVLIKCGEDGLYVRSRGTSDLGRAVDDPSSWSQVRAWQGCFEVEVAGTTGAGDAAIAGFLRALLAQEPPEVCLREAAAVGAFCCERADSTSGIPTYEELQARLATNWEAKA